jgi:hypothetical protein
MPEWFILIQGPLGALVGALVVIAALVKGIVVPGLLHREIVADLKVQRDEWKTIAKPSLDLAEQLVRERAEKGAKVSP